MLRAQSETTGIWTWQPNSVSKSYEYFISQTEKGYLMSLKNQISTPETMYGLFCYNRSFEYIKRRYR